ncbi:MAG: hypothetical protein AVO35_11550 [Candidatus Aegiribacteria sp. MLS_C]|nr:MAG: hypothetical protein AVO35_11550 [Candidatus Aegiribacteria sp. MLS_C]
MRFPETLGSQVSFTAIDFETADDGMDSACAVGLVRVDKGIIRERVVRLIRPPRPSFRNTDIHGISWEDVIGEPCFSKVWGEIQYLLDGTDMLVAHNARFDRTVLQACLQSSGLEVPDIPFSCTMKLARRVWRLYPTSLPDVCRYLNIGLTHHDPLSDAEACARIMIAAMDHTSRQELME